MSDWHRYNYYYPQSYSGSSSTSSDPSYYWKPQHLEENEKIEKLKIQVEKVKFEEFAFNFKKEFEIPAYMRSIMGDFESQLKQKDADAVDEPQLFYFDPKGIVNKWPEKKES